MKTLIVECKTGSKIHYKIMVKKNWFSFWRYVKHWRGFNDVESCLFTCDRCEYDTYDYAKKILDRYISEQKPTKKQTQVVEYNGRLLNDPQSRS